MQSKGFPAMGASQKLMHLASAPYDLTFPGALTAKRIRQFKCSSCGFDLLYATERLDEKTLDALQALADEARLVDQFLAMKKGAVLNKIDGFASENRQVLHTASRDVFTGEHQCPEASASAMGELEKLRAFLSDLQTEKIVNENKRPFSTLVQVGIGGSDLGPRAFALALEAYALPERAVHFIANVDPDDAAAVLKKLNLAQTLFVIVSKSGSTLETLTNEELVRAELSRAGLDPGKHILAVTGEGSPMDDPKRYLASFYMYDYIGGRYSATSMVGAVTLGFLLGFDRLQEILRGAWEMDQAAEERDLKRNLPLLQAMIGIWNHNFLGYATCAILPYSQALSRFPAHLQQCDMESNGKSVTRQGHHVTWKTGPVVWGEPGTNGQHAFYQLLHQGTEIVPSEFIGFRHNQRGLDIEVAGTTSQQKLVANMLAQSLALGQGKDDANPAKSFPGNRPSSVLLADRLTPKQMGSLLALYEHRIVFQGFCWNINSFDQEGVQLGKVLANKLLQLLNSPEKQREYSSVEEALLREADML